jgi:hypothetical protein
VTHPSRRSFLKFGAGVPAAAAANSLFASPLSSPAANTCASAQLPRIVVHPEGHYLSGADGSPFFWLGDTAWQLIQQLTRDQCSYYLHTRARQGFTVIQTVVLAEFGGVKEPTAAGVFPFADQDPRRPNDAFFDRIVDIVDEAASLGLYVALLPAWGDKLTAPWGAGPRLFRNDNLDAAKSYARYLANKVKTRANLVWMLGGDRPPRLTGSHDDWTTKTGTAAGFPPNQDWIPIWRAMADGLKEGSEAPPTIAYHPHGGSQSSLYLHDEPWLSINGMQSGHGSGHDVAVWDMVARDYAVTPARPTLDLEPNYEDHPYNPWPHWDPATGYYRDHDVRKQVYRSVFAGGCGVTYGHHAVWQFAEDGREVINHADRDWRNAMGRPAAQQVGFLRALIQSRPFFRRIPDQSMIAAGQGNGALHMQATRDREGAYAFVYFPEKDQRATIDLAALRSKDLRAWWYDPRLGIAAEIQTPLQPKQEFVSPPYGPDWVLVLDDAGAHYAPPGLNPLPS